MRRLCSASISLLVSAAGLQAQDFPQDLLAVTFTGDAVTLHSRSGVGSVIGSTGRTGHNGMARLGDRLFTTEQVGTGPSAQRFLNTIDDATGVASRTVPITRDLRGLAFGGAFQLLAIADNSLNDQLVRVDTFNGTITVVGSTGFGSIQGLTLASGAFYGWDLQAGLVRIDHLTGAATDVNPNVGATVGIQFLTTMSDGRVIGGQNGLYNIDIATGVASLQGAGQYGDLRGAEERFGVFYNFGQGCAGLALTLSGSPRPGGTIATSSTGHRRFASGFAMIGFSETLFQGLPVPLLLDALIGTSGCFLNAGPDITIALSSNLLGVMSLSLPIPQFTEGLVFQVQHMSFGNYPGGAAFTNGGTVRVAL